ncbi:MAG TPA: DUF4390 domain-containing protein [Methylotenera sp.]|nr:DUF4390 domain-containing protein [Methylotenera sp.]HPH06221.1 DUF4390 domain-containing protein [Methylotenera sp.]HPN00979.1 DUF4390 domain-containing protein [Methylotenera sp.]
MHYCKKIKLVLCAWLLVFIPQFAVAGNTNLHINTAELVAVGDMYELNADVDMKFSPKVEDAISKGFVLKFILEFQLSKPRKYWFDDEVVTVSHEVALNYHALSRQFIVTRGEQQKTFVRLDEALDDLSYISGLNVFKKSEIENEEHLKAALLMRLDTKKLPQALQADDEWHMSSQRFEWTPNFVNQLPKAEPKPEIKLEPAK